MPVRAPSPVSYHAPWWLPGGHLQTLRADWMRRQAIELRWERRERSDGDFNDLAWLEGQPDAPHVVLFHGLEGSARSPYAMSLMCTLHARGWSGVVAHFRDCSGTPYRLRRAYHAGDMAEIAALLAHLRPQAGAVLL